MKKFTKVFFVIVVCITTSVLSSFAQNKTSDKNNTQRPNVVIILADDQGNADAGYQRTPAEVVTPAIDKLASDGVVFTNGYASAYVCAPTRAGLLTGRYQQRFGFFTAADSREGLPLSEITLAELLQKEGYKTGVFGKWHVGLTKPFHPLSRGFDEFYGFLGHGAHDYFDLTCKEDGDDFHQCIYRNNETINDTGYLTDNLAREACSFIKNHAKKKNPFFLYLPFNAVHFPLQAPEEDIKKFNTGNKDRDIMLAMLHRMDIAIGDVIKSLKDEGIYENTLIFYFSDNGGAKKVSANNLPFRDYKQSVYEGGLRVPFVISWPEKLNPAVCNEPVISFDILPTICAALDIELPTDRIYDGKNIFPAIRGELKEPLHPELFWDGNQKKWAVRMGNWKLVSPKAEVFELYDLENDPGEKDDLAQQFPEKTTAIKNRYKKWRNEMATPMGDK